MVSINYAFKEIISKIVYYGPGLSGKTTNLQYVFKKVPSETRGELISLATDADRTLYFDFLPVNVGTIQGFATKFQLYTVPGQVYYNATRKLVLRGVDGLVFVADSQLAKMDENLESIQNLKDNLEEYGYDINQIPLVIQYNKRDLPDIGSIDELEKILNPRGVPYFEASAVTGDGVFKTLKAISKMVLDQVRAKRMDPGRVVKPKPLEVTVGAPSRSEMHPKTAEILASLKQPEIVASGVELPGQNIFNDDKIGTRKVESVTIAEQEVAANVVVSDHRDEKKLSREEVGKNGDLEETTERAVLHGDTPETESKTVESELGMTNDYCEVEAKSKPNPAKYYYDSLPGNSDSFNEEDTAISNFDLKSSLPLAKPQMAESRKVKGRRGGFNIFGWFKRNKNK
jgi:mutual gliding-motility protein MglA